MNKLQLKLMNAFKTVRSCRLLGFQFLVTPAMLAWFTGVVLGLGTVGHRVRADSLDLSNLADVLPSTTHFVVTTSAVSTTYKSIESSDFGKGFSTKIWQDVAAKQASKGVGSLLNPAPWLGVQWSDLGSLEVPGAVAVFSRNEDELAVAFLAKLGPNAQKHPFVQKVIQIHGGASRFKTIKVTAATTMMVMDSTVKNVPSVCVAIGQQWCCVSSSVSAIQEWIAGSGDKSVSFSGKSAIENNGTQDASPGGLRFWLSPWGLMKAYAAKGNAKLLHSADMFGMPGLGEVQGDLNRSESNQSQWSLNYRTSIAQPPANGLALLSFKSGPLPVPPNLAIDTMDFVSASYVDMKPWFQGINYAVDRMIDEETPGNFGDLLDGILTDPDGPKVDVRKELVYKSGPLMMQFAATRNTNSQPGNLVREKVLVCALQDPVGTAKAVKAIFKDDEEVRFEQIGSYQCWTADNDESLFVSLTKGENQVLCVAAVDDKYLYLATNSLWFKNLLRKNENPVPLWTEASSNVRAGDFSARQAIDLSSWLHRSWSRIPEPENRDYRLVDWPAMLLTKVVVGGLSVSEIPKWDEVRAQFGVLVHDSVQKGGRIQGRMNLASPSIPTK